MNLLQRLYQLHQQVPAPWLIALVMLVIFFAFLRQKDTPQADQYDTSGFPQFYMKQVETREYSPEGVLRYRLSTPLVTHFQNDADEQSDTDYTLFELPRMAFYDQQASAPWLITAEQGKSQLSGTVIQLSNNIVIEQQTDSNGLIRITTEQLDIHPKTQYARTDKTVKMRSAKGQITAEGMEADFANSQLQLTSQVKAAYDPR